MGFRMRCLSKYPALTTALSFLMVAALPNAEAQPSASSPWTTEVINSHALGKRTIYIATPTDYEHTSARYPVLILLDGNDIPMFRLVIAQAAYLADNSNGFPQLIVVGIVNGADRIYDMTPPATGTSVGMFPATGGAPAFASFILDEVLPLIRSKYRTHPTTLLAGHSAGGLFALDIAATKPGAFQGIIATSPSLWYNDSSLVVTYSDKIAKSPIGQRVFASSGGLERDIDATTRRFAARLDSLTPGGGFFRYRRYPDDIHSLTPMEGFSDGLRFVFDPISFSHLAIAYLDYANADSMSLDAALRSSEKTYDSAAALLGLPGMLPEDVVNTLGYRLVTKKKPGLAISVFERNVRSYPLSVNVYDSLGDGFLAAGDTASAIAKFKLSVAMARKTGVPIPEETQSKLNALTHRK